MNQSEAFKNEVIVLFDGYSEATDEETSLANCTCTLVRGKNSLSIIDTRTSWDGDEIINELKKLSINPEVMTHVVCTHGHSDHIGCNYLFLNAVEHIVGRAISHKNVYRGIEDDGSHTIDEGISVLPTPGHTLDSVSVIVENSNLSTKPVAVCGDLFERREDCFDESIWIDAGSESIEQQKKNRLTIAEMAGVIIPGHGPKFDVTDEIIAKLRET